MPIFEIYNEIEVELTHKCNWNCPYCAIKVHTLPDISEYDAIAKIRSIQNKSIVTLSGGEPGLISRKTIEICLNILKNKQCQIYLNTNGEFLKKYFDLIDNFIQIIYHCSENINENDTILQLNSNNIRYMIIVNDENITRLDKFIKKYSYIKFDIVEATYNNDGDGITLSKQNKYSILKKYSSNMTKESIMRMFKGKNFEAMKFI